MKGFLSEKRQSKLTAWVVGGLLCASASSAANLVAAEEAAPDFTAPLLGTEGDQEYIDAGVRQADGTYRFTKDSLIFYQNEKDEDLGAIRLLADLKIDAADHILTVKTNTTMGNQGKAAAIQNNGKNLDIKAGTLRLLTNVGPQRPGYAWGILNESGTTTISGMTEIDSYGLTTTHAVEAKTGTVTLEGLKAKTVDRPGSMALLAGTSGQIFVNAAGGTAGSHIVNLDGNVGAMGDASRIDVAMMNQNSGLNGLAFGKGQINFWLQDGAVWKNDMAHRSVPDKTAAGIGKEYDYTFEGSRLSSLRGGADADHAGLIFQKNDKDITVDNYSGYTRVFYEHDRYFDPKKMKGGDFIIKKAAPGSGITLTTDSVGLKLDSVKASEKNLISDTLDALAKKLRYTAYTTNERNLTGKVEIAEGLTSSAVSKRLGDITFDATTGQGSHVYTPAVDAPQGKTDFTTRLSGTAADQEYADANVRLSDGTYLFQKASSIAYQNASAADSGAIKANGDVYIDTQDNALTVTSGAKTADVKEAAAIVNDDGKTVEIKGKTLKLTVNDTTSAAPLERAWGIRMTGGTLSLLGGTTEIDVGGSKESRAVQVSGGTLSIDNLKAKTNVAAADSAVLFAQNDASIGAAKELMLDGHIVAKDAESRIDVNFAGNKSYLKGYAYGDGEIYMTLTGGATWYHEKQNAASPTGFSGSRVTGFKGDMLSWIFQRDDKDITIEEFSDGSYMNVIYEHDAAAPKNIKGGDIVINTAWGNTTATLITDSAGLNTEPTASRAEKNLVSETLNALAGKLRYTDYTPNESTLTGRVQISEGLTSASVGKRLEYITFDETTGRGKYLYTPLVEPAGEQTNTDFTTGITGREINDAPYVNAGVRKADGQYIFTKDSTITSGKDIIEGGGWLGKISAAISNSNSPVPLNIDLNGRNLTVKTTTNISTTGISSIGANSKINIKNPGVVSIDAESTSTGNAAALFVNSGGAIHIENGGGSREDKVLKLRANSTSKSDVAVIKSMNGAGGVQSNITIDGLVDVLADGDTTTNGKGANEAVSAVASKIDIGGGTIRATGGAWAAIRAYGEFTSGNYGTVNFNVTKDKDGLANGAGENRAVIEGDLVTNGGMGTKGRISVGLSTPESYWLGNYADASGYGVTQGQLGSVNLFMKNGSYWKGFSNGTMKMEMSGEGTKWTGFNISNNLQLALSDGAIWYNAITPEQTDQKDKPAISRVYHFTGSGGFIDMTGANRFLASSSSLNGNPVQTGSSAIEEKGLGETGDLTIANYSGDTKVLYRHDADTPTTVYGGKLTIEKAAANSSITLSTDSVGLDTESKKAADKNLVSATLNALANKLYYTAYTTGERNLSGKAEIAEGLTTSAASKRIENITFDKSSGQGGYAYTPAVDPKPDTPKPDTPKPDTPKPDTPKPDTPKPDTPKPDTPKPDTPKPDTPKPDTPKPDTPKPDPKIEYGDYETKLMSGVKSAMTASTMAWRAEANDLMKRMGDLRLSPQDAGVWARVYRGKSTSNKDNANFRMNYSTIQVGYDKQAGKDWRVGIAGSYMKGSSSYANGSGKNKEGNLGIYGTWTGKSGQYVDLIMKVGRLSNEYTVYNDYNHYVKGDFRTWGGSLSAEYGKRIPMKGGSFVEPQLELIYSHLNGASYTGDTDYAGMKMYVHQKPFDSFIGRVGFGIGKETERSTYYARVSLYHEFAGDMHTDYSDGFTPKSTSQSGSDTWVGVQLGGTMKLGDRTNLYGNFEKTFGGDVKTDWRVDAGLRWNF